ncbi:hypothetical protein L1D51_16960, partial [Pseudoalteromonas shioyasakiensis]|uniref:hypothetical protein n=1 Tax=Pseudoalteromonas shioyasakiensis TaxID=1190813 RepID=UPI001EFE512F
MYSSDFVVDLISEEGVSGQPSAVSRQPSAVSRQPSEVRYQWPEWVWYLDGSIKYIMIIVYK